MKNQIEETISEIFNRIEIHQPYSPGSFKITQFTWNQNMEDFEVIYFLNKRKYIFHYNDQIASQVDVDFLKNPLEQLESEVLYIKRMYERGIGAKEYYPFTDVE